MSLKLIDDAPGDPRNAAYCAVACDLAYLPKDTGPPEFARRLGLDAELISVDNTQVYVGRDDASIVLAFRGSESPDSIDGFKDWLLTNAMNFLVLPEGRIGTDFAAAGVGARFHAGFMGALAEIWEPLKAAVETAVAAKERPVWVTGHSLGGAIALLAAWRLQQNFVNIHAVITFGAPMIGNDLAAAAFEREFPGKIFRYVDSLDIVPWLPTVSLATNTYKHCQAEQVLADPAVGAGDTAASALRELAGRATQGLLDATLIDNLWGRLRFRIANHMMSNYQARIDERLNSRA